MPTMKDKSGVSESVSVQVLPAEYVDHLAQRIVAEMLCGVKRLDDLKFNLNDELQVVPVLENLVSRTGTPEVMRQALLVIKRLTFMVAVLGERAKDAGK